MKMTRKNVQERVVTWQEETETKWRSTCQTCGAEPTLMSCRRCDKSGRQLECRCHIADLRGFAPEFMSPNLCDDCWGSEQRLMVTLIESIERVPRMRLQNYRQDWFNLERHDEREWIRIVDLVARWVEEPIPQFENVAFKIARDAFVAAVDGLRREPRDRGIT